MIELHNKIENISLVILTKNSLHLLKNNTNIHNVFSDVVIIDDYSTDETKNFCNMYKYKYIKRHLNGDFASQRNYALDKVKNDWVLFLDSDESIDENFLQEIITKVNHSYEGFYIKRNVKYLDHFMEGTEMGSDYVLRLAKKGCGKWVRKVHEYWDVKGNVGKLNNGITHLTAVNLKEFVKKIVNYSVIHASENKISGKSVNLFKVLIYPKLKVFNNFILKSGYKDGEYGFVVSVFMSFHSFLSWSTEWLQNRKRNIE